MPGPGSLDLYKPELKMEKRNICVGISIAYAIFRTPVG